MHAYKKSEKLPRVVGRWLLVGLIMVFVQIVIGGITRLTDSGLSITEWNVIKGVLPPLTEESWLDAFEKYKTHAKTQFEAIHADMSLSEFKFIYFWEYFHRLWARSMGFVFLFPFLYFWRKGYISKPLMKHLIAVVIGAAVVASFGWIMVASGLNTPHYAWVNAYKLTIHLSLAITLFAYLLWITLKVIQPQTEDGHFSTLRRWAWGITAVIAVQLVLGGLMSGMKAGLFFPHFPQMTADGQWIAGILWDADAWKWSNMTAYNKNAFAPALIQLLHRTTAYLLCVLVVIFFVKLQKTQGSARLKLGGWFTLSMLVVQVTLGVLTLIACVGTIPETLGVLHQAGGILLLASFLFTNYQLSPKGGKNLWITSSQNVDN